MSIAVLLLVFMFLFAVSSWTNISASGDIITRQTLIPSELGFREPDLSVPEFIFLDNTTDLLTFSLESFWDKGSCSTNFECTIDYTTGWNDNTSFKVSTLIAGNKTIGHWSWIRGDEINVSSGENYSIITHIKVNEFSNGSNIAIEGYNVTSHTWHQLIQCPSGIMGPVDWQVNECTFNIPLDTNKIRIALNAGMSLSEGSEATAWFDSVYMRRSIGESPLMLRPFLKLDLVLKNVKDPSTMAFIDTDEFLMLDRVNGTVERVVNGQKLDRPLIDLEVSQSEGLLGIAVGLNQSSGLKQVYLYYTGSTSDCNCQGYGNYLVRYDLAENNSKLANPDVLLRLPTGNWPLDEHHGGPLAIGPDGNIYLVTGDLGRVPEIYSTNQIWNYTPSKVTNSPDGIDPDGSAGVLRISPTGSSVGNLIGDKNITGMYYAYGIRNSFGLDFDPITKKLWITENGPDRGDEINLVEPGFNSGWALLAGTNFMPLNPLYDDVPLPRGLFDFYGKGNYSAPEFEWRTFAVGPTAMAFIDAKSFGEEYFYNLFVGDSKGNLYFFKLNDNRTGFDLHSELQDNAANSEEELESIIIGKNFGVITDLKIGPDGDLYVVTISPSRVYRISYML